ncbi:ricin B-like lectin [Panus rudis PR-1116 ss-1]|nr:ricin B-like lectin [Panus rudis PR-1116 ss-1]
MSASLPLQSGVYFIQNIGTGTVIDLHNGSTADNTEIQGHAKHALSNTWVPAQLWIISLLKASGSHGIYTIQNASGRTYMDLSQALATDGNPIIGWTPSSSKAHQQWRIIPNAKQTAFVIQNVSTGTYVDLYGGIEANGTAITGYSGEGPATTNRNQLWNFIRV